MDPLSAIKSSVPPAVDDISWLTILSTYISPELLPELAKLLTPQLTSSVGWDLIGLLLPLHGSEECLQIVGKYGNPRECVLKICEALRDLKFEESSDAEEEPNITKLQIAEKTVDDTSESTSAMKADHETPTATSKFLTLIGLLTTLQPRIRTAHPSRFLSTSLTAVLATYSDAVKFVPADDITFEVIRLIKTLSGVKRPHLPHRQSSSSVLSNPSDAPDPEGNEAPAPNEAALQARLLASFTTHILEDYILSTDGLYWSARLYEKEAENLKSYTQRFAKDEAFQSRESTVGQLVALGLDLSLTNQDLLDCIILPVIEASDEGPPNSPSDIPLSQTGSLFLLVARIASATLFGSSLSVPSLQIFPHHAAITHTFIGSAEAGGSGSIGGEPGPIIDAVLAIGFSCSPGDPAYEGDEVFYQHLQNLSLLSANTPSGILRYNAHVLTSRTLHSHPSDVVRLLFIRDTLENCPFENLKGSAVSWLKTEILKDDDSIFRTPVAINELAPYLFPQIAPEPLAEAWMLFKANLPFYLAALNFYYLLVTHTMLREKLDVQSFSSKHDIGNRFLRPLHHVATVFKEGLAGSLAAEEGEDGVQAGLSDIRLLEINLLKVEHSREQAHIS